MARIVNTPSDLGDAFWKACAGTALNRAEAAEAERDTMKADNEALREMLEAVEHLAAVHREASYVVKISPTSRNAATVAVLLELVDEKLVPLLAQHGSEK